jgi:hypothetical protein
VRRAAKGESLQRQRKRWHEKQEQHRQEHGESSAQRWRRWQYRQTARHGRREMHLVDGRCWYSVPHAYSQAHAEEELLQQRTQQQLWGAAGLSKEQDRVGSREIRHGGRAAKGAEQQGAGGAGNGGDTNVDPAGATSGEDRMVRTNMSGDLPLMEDDEGTPGTAHDSIDCTPLQAVGPHAVNLPSSDNPAAKKPWQRKMVVRVNFSDDIDFDGHTLHSRSGSTRSRPHPPLHPQSTTARMPRTPHRAMYQTTPNSQFTPRQSPRTPSHYTYYSHPSSMTPLPSATSVASSLPFSPFYSRWLSSFSPTPSAANSSDFSPSSGDPTAPFPYPLPSPSLSPRSDAVLDASVGVIGTSLDTPDARPSNAPGLPPRSPTPTAKSISAGLSLVSPADMRTSQNTSFVEGEGHYTPPPPPLRGDTPSYEEEFNSAMTRDSIDDTHEDSMRLDTPPTPVNELFTTGEGNYDDDVDAIDEEWKGGTVIDKEGGTFGGSVGSSFQNSTNGYTESQQEPRVQLWDVNYADRPASTTVVAIPLSNPSPSEASLLPYTQQTNRSMTVTRTAGGVLPTSLLPTSLLISAASTRETSRAVTGGVSEEHARRTEWVRASFAPPLRIQAQKAKASLPMEYRVGDATTGHATESTVTFGSMAHTEPIVAPSAAATATVSSSGPTHIRLPKTRLSTAATAPLKECHVNRFVQIQQHSAQVAAAAADAGLGMVDRVVLTNELLARHAADRDYFWLYSGKGNGRTIVHLPHDKKANQAVNHGGSVGVEAMKVGAPQPPRQHMTTQPRQQRRQHQHRKHRQHQQLLGRHQQLPKSLEAQPLPLLARGGTRHDVPKQVAAAIVTMGEVGPPIHIPTARFWPSLGLIAGT